MRERRVLTDIEQSLAHDDPGLARQLSHMALTPPAEEPPPERYGGEETGRGIRRFAGWCAVLTLVLFVVAGVTASTEVLYCTGVVALVAAGSWVASRAPVHRE
ncbi:DUF3040 domain-containing protein [Streptomyces sp. V4-01]|uniref:DUF3040 domain-containing protein n=1 Tax=Actinacidiphila polyblastidii TaxID=3110430 RepID=A0ABU7PHM2_9ACTN|nr:DUF3040 domain-containing protein [Streptomyces sp. V4-01]